MVRLELRVKLGGRRLTAEAPAEGSSWEFGLKKKGIGAKTQVDCCGNQTNNLLTGRCM